MKTLLLAALLALPLFAADGPKLGETIDVSVVNVDAVVTDHQGNRVRGLTQDDFQIFENGKLQPVSNFSEICGTDTPVCQAQTGVSVLHQPRTIIVFIEHFRAPEFRRDPFFNGMREYLHRTVRPGDAVKIVTFAKWPETRLGFTDKLDAIDRTLEQIRSESGPGVDDTTFEDYLLGETFNSRINASSNGRRSVAGFSGPGGMGIARNNPRDFGSTDFGTTSNRPTNFQQNFRALRMRDKVAAITSLMNSIAGADSKKVFVLAVRRFSPSGRDLFEVDNLTPDYGWSNRFRNDSLIDYVAKTANANGITVYPLHPEGLGSDGFGIESLHDYNLIYSQLPYLDELAKQTGGKLAWGRDIEKDLPKMADDLDAYYSLGYRATNHNVDRARAIVVKAKNPDYTVRSRREYVEKSDQTRMRERVLATLLDQAPASSMKISVNVGRSRFASNSGYYVPVTIYIPSAALMTDGGRGEFSVFVAWRGRTGDLGQVTKQSQKFTMTTKMPETFTYTFELFTDGSADELSVGVFDELSKDYGLTRVDLTNAPTVARLQ